MRPPVQNRPLFMWNAKMGPIVYEAPHVRMGTSVYDAPCNVLISIRTVGGPEDIVHYRC